MPTSPSLTPSLASPSRSIRNLFLAEFYAERGNFANVPTDQIRGAGKTTKASPNGEDELWWMAQGPQMLQRWEDWRDQSGWQVWTTPDGIPAIELEVTEEHNGQTLKAIIDRVFLTEGGGLVILDLKSGSRTPVADVQLGFGASLIRLKYGVQVVGGTYWMAREGQCTGLQSLPNWTPALAAHYARQLQTARRENIYLPHVTNMCRACGVRDYCVAVGGKKMHLDPDYKFVVEEFEGAENDCGV